MTPANSVPAKGNSAALTQARAETSARKHRDVVTAIARASAGGQSVSVSTLAASAGVSRQFLYSRPDLMEGLRRHQERYPDSNSAPLRESRVSDLVNAHDMIKRLKLEARELTRKLDAGLAAQIELRDETRLRQLYDTRGQEIERLLTQNSDLARTVFELRERVRSLEDDLTIERSALRALAGQPDNITPIRFGD